MHQRNAWWRLTQHTPAVLASMATFPRALAELVLQFPLIPVTSMQLGVVESASVLAYKLAIATALAPKLVTTTKNRIDSPGYRQLGCNHRCPWILKRSLRKAVYVQCQRHVSMLALPCCVMFYSAASGFASRAQALLEFVPRFVTKQDSL
jgi:hypothetical protein